MAIFLASWGMVFLTLFFSYAVLRFQSDVWPPPESPPVPGRVLAMAWINTGLLLAASVALRSGVRCVERGEPRGLRRSAGIAVLLGGVFLALQVESWRELWLAGLSFRRGTYESLLYGLTAFHALHVVAGILVLLWILPVSARDASNPLRVADRIRVRSGAAFWHFVDGAWIATFLVAYVL
jgi:heme/copper-type cytochrome/quinol oxidase subunit 3